jgi:hypothetical protein
MVHARDDVIELLLPGEPMELQRRAIALTTFARLLSSDAGGVRFERTSVTFDSAVTELARDAAERTRGALRELLRAHVVAATRASSFLWVGEPAASAPVLWRRSHALAHERGDSCAEGSDHRPGGDAHVPLPGESALSVARRLLEAAARAGYEEDELALWRARCTWAEHGSRAAEDALEAGWEASASLPFSRRRAWLAHRVEAALERGAVRRARAWLDEHAERIAGDERLACLDQWTRVALGELPARALAWSGALPLALVEWRAACAVARPFLAGREPRAADRGEADGANRRNVGASVLAVLALTRDGSQRAVFVDVAAALRSRSLAWLAARDGAPRQSGAPERVVVARARRFVWRRGGTERSRDALDAENCEALVVEPVLDRHGEVAGWIWLEFGHRLLPSSADLESAAAAWRERVLDARDDSAQASTDPRASATPASTRAANALVADLAMKTAQRRWWIFAARGEPLESFASGGIEFDSELAAPAAPARELDLASGGEPACSPDRALGRDRARILTRALRTRGWVEFDEPAPGFSVHPSSASGVALAIECVGRARVVLAIESSRRRDFKPADLERWEARARDHAAEFGAAAFRDWHRARFGTDVWLDGGTRLAARLSEVAAAAHCSAPLAIVGPAASGKHVLARWVHFERSGGAERGPWVISDIARDGVLGPNLAALRNAVERGDVETLIWPHADGATALQQIELLRFVALEGAPSAGRPRVVVTTNDSPAALAARGAWPRELADAFAHLELRVAPLSARRVEIPGLVETLAARFAERERRDPPRFDDAALALLWRREWRRNLRELEAVVYRLVIGQSGRDVDADVLAGELSRMGLDAPRKLSSRQAEPTWIAQALETTRHESGGINKTRAAAYLGWDPDTLVTRMRACGLDPDAPSGTATG